MMIAQASVLQKYAKSLVFSGELSHRFVDPAVVGGIPLTQTLPWN